MHYITGELDNLAQYASGRLHADWAASRRPGVGWRVSEFLSRHLVPSERKDKAVYIVEVFSRWHRKAPDDVRRRLRGLEDAMQRTGRG